MSTRLHVLVANLQMILDSGSLNTKPLSLISASEGSCMHGHEMRKCHSKLYLNFDVILLHAVRRPFHLPIYRICDPNPHPASF